MTDNPIQIEDIKGFVHPSTGDDIQVDMCCLDGIETVKETRNGIPVQAVEMFVHKQSWTFCQIPPCEELAGRHPSRKMKI